MRQPSNITSFGYFTVTVAATTVFGTSDHTIYTAAPTTASSATSVLSAAAAIATPLDPVLGLLSKWPQCIVSPLSTMALPPPMKLNRLMREFDSNLSQLKGLH